jgi:hypothetical protein
MQGMTSPSMATAIGLVLVVLLVVAVVRAMIKPLLAIALVAIVLIMLGVVSTDAVGQAVRSVGHSIVVFVQSLFDAVRGR